MDAIRIEGVSKHFSYRQGVSRNAAMGDSHWLIGLLLAARSPKQSVTALDRISLLVEEGSFVGLLGPNGAGKTTLLKCIASCLLPDEGTITVFGIDPAKSPRSLLRLISLCRSDTWVGIEHGLSVLDNLLFHGLLYGLRGAKARARALDLLELVGIAHKSTALPGNLSSGERQKLSLVRALMTDSRVLLLDEPTAYLDPDSRLAVRNYLQERVRASGVTALLTTHNLQEVEDLCERVLIINRGKLIADLSPTELKLVSQSVNQVKIVGSLGGSATHAIHSLIEGAKGILEAKGLSEAPGVVEITAGDLVSAYSTLDNLKQHGFCLQSLGDGSLDIEDAYLKVVERDSLSRDDLGDVLQESQDRLESNISDGCDVTCTDEPETCCPNDNPADDLRTKTSGARTWLAIASSSFLHQFRGWVFFVSNWLLEFMGLLVSTSIMYYLAAYITSQGSVLNLNAHYPTYVVTNMIIAQLVSASLSAYYDAYSQGFWGGSFEMLMVTPNGVSAYITGFSAWIHARGLVSFGTMALLSRMVFDVNIIGSNIWAIGPLVLATLVGMTGLGLISASMFTLLGAKRSEPVSWLLRHICDVACGVYIPIACLPSSLQRLSSWLPQTHIYTIGRALLLVDDGHVSLKVLESSVHSLIVLGVPTLILGVVLFRLSLKRAYSGALSTWS